MMMGDLRTFSRQFLTEFIELYKQETAVWKVKSKEYRNRNAKKQSYEILLNKLREVEPTADKQTVTKKINSLRTSFRKELRKVQNSQKAGNGGDDLYIPSLWYYPLLTFLIDQDTTDPATANIKVDHGDDSNGTDEDSPLQTHLELITSPGSQASYQESYRSVSPPTNASVHSSLEHRRKRRRCDPISEILHDVRQKIRIAEREDEFDIIGKHWGNKLRHLSNSSRCTATLAEKLINDVFFEASMGNLLLGSHLSIPEHHPPPTVPHYQSNQLYSVKLDT